MAIETEQASDGFVAIEPAIHGRIRTAAALLLCTWTALDAGDRIAMAADLTFNITYITERDPLAGSLPGAGCTGCVYGDVWAENGFAYVGSDVNGGGMNIFSISNPSNPVFLTRYPGDQFEDVEVWDGVGYFGSDTNTTSGTGVDIVDLSIPFDPIMLSRFNGADCVAGQCGHNKVHTLSVYNGFMYTADNATDVVKIVNVSNPSNPVLVKSLDLGLASGTNSHEVIARNNRLYIASKDNSSTTCCGWTHIYDVSNPAVPVLLKAFLSGPRSHTALPSPDDKTLIVTEERPNGNVNIYDISMINSPNDTDNPVLLSVLNRTNVGIDAHSPHHPHLHGNLLFIPWYEAGLQVFNIVDPAHPVHVGSFDTYPGTSTNYNGNWGVDLSMGLNRVLISDRSRGLIVVDASDVIAPGDYDQDMSVDEADYIAWYGAFGTSDSGLHTGPIADGNANGIVDAADYVIWRKHAAENSAGAGSIGPDFTVPEPAAVLLFVLGLTIVKPRYRVRTAN